MANTHFDFLTLNFLQKAEGYPGSVGTFRYRLKREGKANNGSIQAWVYENICCEKARDIETETFPWRPEGMEALRNWLEQTFLYLFDGFQFILFYLYLFIN